ncbi:MAG: DUF2894 domain-containing protein [Paraburkholderia sp.]|jgi:hypothetical protein|uniref:DUF2894 domain-containing protein n=1 Tax=Burkholderiaceae TaxID=119060 RepID=UPI0010F78E62|nr:DUF2894 domain-containing protein [Burkholderia sp. 4M9327F10]
MANEARAQLDAWRERGADRLDPVRFRFIEALDRRAAGHSGEARRVLDERLSRLLAAYAADLERPVPGIGESGNADARQDRSTRDALAALNEYIAGHHDALPGPASYPELDMLEYFREIWSRFRTGRQLQQSLEQVPGNAGPLNSSSLVHRSLSLMRELSPGYLQQFLSYVDALSWMEQMSSGDLPVGKEAPRPGSAKKGARAKAR